MMTADDRLRLIRVKVERAYKHIEDLEEAIAPFGGAVAHNVWFDSDANTGKPILQSGPVHIYSSRIPAITGDAVHNLMCALDHLAFHLVEAGVVAGIPRKRIWEDIQFPIAYDLDTYESRKKRYVEGARREAIEELDRLKPYKDGNPALWLLHKLDNTDKHSFITATGKDFIMDGVSFKANDPYFSDFGLYVPANKQKDVDLSGGESLIQPAVGRANALLPTLCKLADYVSSIVESFRPFLD
jgi:hypothetical protein